MALMNDVYRYIENNYRPNEPVFLSELNIPGMKAVSVRQQMKKLTESGQLKRSYQKKVSGRWRKLLWLCWRDSFCESTRSDYSGSRSI